jgi:hypothetical protein
MSLDLSILSLQQTVLPLDVSVLQQTVLPLDVSVLQQTVQPGHNCSTAAIYIFIHAKIFAKMTIFTRKFFSHENGKGHFCFNPYIDPHIFWSRGNMFEATKQTST